jgi:hypothetical protein
MAKEVSRLESEEEKYPKLKIWLVRTVDTITGEEYLRSVCTVKALAEWHERALKDWVRRASEGEHSGERGNRVVQVEESDANHLYGERTMETIRGLMAMDKERSI